MTASAPLSGPSTTPEASPDPFELPVVPGDEVRALLGDANVPVLVDFFATWCGPCAWIVPTLRALTEQHGDRIRIVKVDVDEDPGWARELRIGSVPTLVLFEAGVEVERSIGVEPERVRDMADAAVARRRGLEGGASGKGPPGQAGEG
jgi:thioredoxin 1